MKILFVTSRFPYPPLRGDQAIPYHRLRLLSKSHSITLLSFYEHESELSGLAQLQPFCEKIYTVRLPFWRSLLNVALNGAFSPLPLQVLYYRSAGFERLINKLVSENTFDLVHTYLLRMAPYVTSGSAPKVLELIDSMQLNWMRRVESEKFPKRWFFREELRRVVSYERGIGDRFDQLLVVSEKDRSLVPASNIDVVPLGVDTETFKPGVTDPKANSIVFSGNMGYSPNVKAAVWFAEKCLPAIQEAVPNATFTIIGTNPTREILALSQRKGIIVAGFVKSMPEVLASASVAVAPMLSGSGMQFKILEAMSCGLPVVTTTLGLGDIKAERGKEILVADDVEEFVEAVVKALASPEMASKLGGQARRFVIDRHSWESVVAKVETIYSRVLKQASNAQS